MSTRPGDECCPPFDPEPWDRKEFVWDHKRFVQDRVRSLLHIPLNFGAVMKRNLAAIEAAGARPEAMVVLSDENSLWGADVYIAVAKEVPGATMATLSGTFVSRVFEGPYGKVREWTRQMRAYVADQGKTLGHLYVYYTTCPKCARRFGKNYVVMLARV
jgi:hypothetical protein